MADTKKEHYVPRCYLKNFENEQERINVFDKFKLQLRNQRIIEVAMENYFYDINFDKMMELVKVDRIDKFKEDILTITGAQDWETVRKLMGNDKYIEKEFFAKQESLYNILLNRIIEKSHKGNQWVIDNCSCCSDDEKLFLSCFIAIQIIRTKTFRESLGETIEKLYQTLAYKSQMNDEDALSKNEILVSADKDYVKLEHTNMILNDDATMRFAETLYNHLWVIYVNKTETSFYTSDNPVATIPHKFHKYMSYSGFNSDGIEIVFPISPTLLLGMYDKKTYYKHAKDRSYVAITEKEEVDYFNEVQVTNSYRCVFSNQNDFEIAKKLCEKNPQLQQYQSRVEVL